MKYSILALASVGMCYLALAAGASTAVDFAGFSSFSSPGTDPLIVTASSPAHISISLINPAVEIVDKTLDFQVCQSAALAGASLTSEPGAPSLPQITRIFQIPELGGVELVVRSAEFDLIENYNAYPCPIEEAGSQRYERDPAFYRKNAWYPENVIEISEPEIFRDFRIVTVTLNPVQVNPVTQQARVYRNMEADVVANDAPGVNELLHPRRPSGAFASLYRGCIRNLDEGALDEVTVTPGTYLILSRDNAQLNPWVDSLAEWRTRCGFDVVVERYAVQPTASAMFATIQGYYDDSAAQLEHVCIVGDPQGNTFGMPTGSSGLMDHYFARLAGADIIPDVSIGRISVSNEQQMSTVWKKITVYERDPLIDSTNWFTNSFLYANVGFQQPTNYLEVQWADQQLRQFTGIQNNTISTVTGSANGGLIQDQFVTGIGLFLYAGYWLGTLPNIASICESGRRQPICILMAGSTGGFDQNTSLSESYPLAGIPIDLHGGIAAIGFATANENGLFFRTFGAGFIRGLCPLQIERIGLCQMTGFMTLHEMYGPNNSGYTTRLPDVNLIGDPALRIWTDVPAVLSADYPATVTAGAREIVVNVTDSLTGAPVNDALVVAWKPNETMSRVLTDLSGTAIVPVTIDSIGTLKLTITKKNCKPYLVDLPCQESELSISVASLTIDDDNLGGTEGNNNHEYNPGELIDLNIVLENYGTALTGTDITAVMQSMSPYLTVTGSTSTYPDLQPGERASGHSAYRIQVAPDMQNSVEGVLRLNVTATDFDMTSAIPVVCRAGAATYSNHVFVSDPLEPATTQSLRVTITNTGAMAFEGVTGTLLSRDPLVSVPDNSGSFGNIPVGLSATNTTDVFWLTANPLVYRGHQALMSLILESTTDFHDTVSFIVSCGTATVTDPVGPDAVGYYAYDDVDTSYDAHPSFEYLDLSSGLGEDLNLNDVGKKTDITQVWSTVRQLPFEFTYYDETFDTITICSNGWIAFGNEGWCDEPFNRAIPAVMAPPNMVAVYWDDLKTSGVGDGVWTYYDMTRSAYVIQWRATGGTTYTQANLDFELMILDPAAYPPIDDNGKLVLLYNDVTMNLETTDTQEDLNGCTIGIQNRHGTGGLQIAYRDLYASGAANIVDGRVILIETGDRSIVGTIEGRITDAESGLPIEHAQVSLVGFPYQAESNTEGFYQIENVVIGSYSALAHLAGFNDSTVANVTVELNSTATVNFGLLHPEFAISREIIHESLIDGPTLQTSFEIVNDGNGPLEYATEVFCTVGGEIVEPWDNLQRINVSNIAADLQIMGCEFVDDYWFVSGASGVNDNNFIYSFDAEGNYLGATAQPTTDPLGWYDMAWDGQFLYGSEQGTHELRGIDSQGNLRTAIPCPFLNPARAIAYDPATDHFWVADLIRDIYEIDRDGTLISTIENSDGLAITGLGWHATEPDGYSLIVFCQDEVVNEAAVWRIHPVTGNSEFVVYLPGEEGDHAGGCTVTSGWNDALTVIGGIMQNPDGDRLEVFDIDTRTDWIELTPIASTISAGQRQEIIVSFDGTTLRPDLYQATVLINCPVLALTMELPIELDVVFDASWVEHTPPTPNQYALYQNYPNPFNSSTRISYDLKTAGHATLRVYNVVGQEVATLFDEHQAAGKHIIQFNAHELPSGIYFLRLNSGDFTKTSKMVLLK